MLDKDGQTKTPVWRWMVSAFGAAILSAGLAVAVRGTGDTGVKAAVRVAALLSFLLFFAAYAGRPLAFLFGPPFDGVARRGREFGLAFAAALAVHLGLVVLSTRLSADPFVPNRLEIGEMFGAAWIYALAVFSIPRLQSILGPAAWRRLRILGMDYIALIFAYNFFPYLLKPLLLPFLLLAIGAIVLRIAAAIRGRPDTTAPDPARDVGRLHIERS